MKYPSVQKIIEFNVLALNLIKAKKADKPELKSRQKLVGVLEECKKSHGDVFDKSVILLKGLVQKHAFASGNRCTAFLAVKYFLLENKANFEPKTDSLQAKVLLGIRENYYSDEEIKEWLKHGKIKEFVRR